MTAFTRTAAGDWSDPSKWDVGAGYPDGITDTADLATFDVTLDVDVACGNVDLSGASAQLSIPGPRTLNVRSYLYVRNGAALVVSGTLAADPGFQIKMMLYTGGVCAAGAGAEFVRVQFYAVTGAWTVASMIADCSETNLATCEFVTDGATTQMTIDTDISAAYIYACVNSTIVINAGVDIKMNLYGAVLCLTGGKFNINGTRALPVTIGPRTAGESWSLHLYGGASGSVISNLICTGNLWSLGNGTDGLDFSRYPASVTPINREANIDNDAILGRGRSRIHHKGNQAAIIEISGSWAAADRQYEIVDAMMNSGDLVGLATDEVHVPAARVFMHDYKRLRGKLYWPYTITIIEDE